MESQDKLQIFRHLPYWEIPDTVTASESFISFTLKDIWTLQWFQYLLNLWEFLPNF